MFVIHRPLTQSDDQFDADFYIFFNSFQMTEFENLQQEKIDVFQRRLQFASERCRLLEAHNRKTQADMIVAIKKYILRT